MVSLGAWRGVPTNVPEALRSSLGLLTKQDRRRYLVVVLAQMATSLLDLIGVLLVGLVGVLAAASVQGTQPPPFVVDAVGVVGAQDLPLETLAGLVAVAAAGFLLTKSALSALLMRRVFRFLGNRQAIVSTRLTAQLLAQPLLSLDRRSSQETAYGLSTAVSTTVTATLGSLAILLSEVTLLAVLGIALFVVDPIVTIVGAGYFALVGFSLQWGLRDWSSRIGERIGSTAIAGQRSLQEAMVAYREIFVLGRRSLYVDNIGKLWSTSGGAQGDQMFLNQLPKLGYEAALVLGAVGLAAWQFATSTPVEAMAMLALFLAAGSRVLPSMLRLNSLVLGIRSGVASAKVLFPIVAELEDSQARPIAPMDAAESLRLSRESFPGFQPSVVVRDVSVLFPASAAPALVGISLEIPAGAKVALVGPTGAGKSTLADVILGVLEPATGYVEVSGMSAMDAIARWPGAIACVPQNVAMINGTVRDNVALGLPAEVVHDAQVWDALEQAYLAAFLGEHREGLDTPIGEHGVRLSGGQRQRLGLARALFSNPQLIVLDEATSALDAETEQLIAKALDSLGDGVTTITVAHRLTTVRGSDLVIYLEGGRMRAAGTFESVRAEVPEFDRNARLLGL